MSKFNGYAKRIDGIAKKAFSEYRKAEQALEEAEKKAKEYPQQHGFTDAQYAAKSARAQADLMEARAALKAAQQAFEGYKKDIMFVRSELSTELENLYAADPKRLDSNTLELMKSGILKPNEYLKLMYDAQGSGNHTMVRLIGKYAADAAEVDETHNGHTSPSARDFRAVSFMAKQDDGSDYLKAADYLLEVYNRSADNPAMIDKWDELCSEVIEDF